MKKPSAFRLEETDVNFLKWVAADLYGCENITAGLKYILHNVKNGELDINSISKKWGKHVRALNKTKHGRKNIRNKQDKT